MIGCAQNPLPVCRTRGTPWRELDQIAPTVGRREFVRFVDAAQQSIYGELLREYHDENFAKLVALKLCNLALARYHFTGRHARLASNPIQLMVDPANACQLGCPACVHSSNKAYAALFDWPRQTLPVETYEAFLSRFGPFAFAATLYNYGEPLLHKRFDEIVRLSKEYLLFTMTSTNLSMPLGNTDPLVASGLDYMILSIDGTTQDVYASYRRGGRLDLVLENVRKLVQSKRRLGSKTPYLVWQFLTFEHNLHQTDEAIRMAKKIGVNEISVTTPFGPEADDPTIRAATSKRQGNHIFKRWAGNWCTPAIQAASERRATDIDAAFRTSWEERLELAGSVEEPDHRESGTCRWLYYNLTLDGASRLMPCCMAPDKNEKKVLFGRFDGEKADSGSPSRDPVNSRMATLARTAFSDRSAYDSEIAHDTGTAPFCAKCTEKPSSPYNLPNVANDIRAIDSRHVVPRGLIDALTTWG